MFECVILNFMSLFKLVVLILGTDWLYLDDFMAINIIILTLEIGQLIYCIVTIMFRFILVSVSLVSKKDFIGIV